MSAYTQQQVRRLRLPRIRDLRARVASSISRVARKMYAPHKGAIENLMSVPLTVLGTASIDFAAFHISHGWGWLILGVSLIILEAIIANEQ